MRAVVIAAVLVPLGPLRGCPVDRNERMELGRRDTGIHDQIDPRQYRVEIGCSFSDLQTPSIR
jgi:hypothetical protein